MGRSGNNPGYKVFSISTTIRNPRRNTEFLEILREFDNTQLTSETKNKIYVELIRNGIYKVNNLDNAIKEKYEKGILLTNDEIYKIIKENPQKTGDEGRIMTQIRALKDTGLVNLIGSRNKKLLQITPLGKKLLNNENVEDVYAKAMIGLHANNPQRTTIYNKACPFLNTLFMINEVNQLLENEKGILWHEFAVFVLSMKDCDYQKVAKLIVENRKKNKNEINKVYLENYLYNIAYVNKVEFRSILRDYADDVYRKFNMTGLLDTSGFGKNTYVRFDRYNLSKVKSILEKYSNYQYKEFANTDEYTEYLTNIVLPWEKSDDIKRQIIEDKKKNLNVEIDENVSLDNQIKQLDSINNKRVFEHCVDNMDRERIKKELIILSRNSNQKSEFEAIPEPVRLEWLIALMTAKIYGAKYVKPNLVLDNQGIPKSHATGGMADIEFITEEFYCLIEVTLQRDYKQQENNETTSISDHLRNLDVPQEKGSILIAPRIHNRVVDYFNFCSFKNKLAILAVTIELYIEMIEKNLKIEELKEEFDKMNEKMMNTDLKEYCDWINNYRI